MSHGHVKTYFWDCVHIRGLAKSMGHDLSMDEACAIWELHSEDYAATWLRLEDDDSIKNVIEYHMPIKNKMCPHCNQIIRRPSDGG